MIRKVATRTPSVVAVALVAVAVGCSSRPYGTVPVHGRVTFGGKQPPARCEVYFVPVATEEGPETPFVPRSGVGYADATGAFEVTSFRNGDGLLPGTYEVRVECRHARPQAEHGHPGEMPGMSFVPDDFTAPQLDVPAGASSLQYEIDVPSRHKA